MNENEMWVLYDRDFKPLNKIVPRYTPLTKNEYSLGVHIWVKSNDKYLIFQRSASKRTFPNYFEMIGGGINGYDDSLESAIREVKEESGLDIRNREPKLIFMSRVEYGNGIIYPEHTFVYMVEMDDISIKDIRIEEGKNLNPAFKTKNEILELIDQGLFIPVVNYRDKIFEQF